MTAAFGAIRTSLLMLDWREALWPDISQRFWRSGNEHSQLISPSLFIREECRVAYRERFPIVRKAFPALLSSTSECRHNSLLRLERICFLSPFFRVAPVLPRADRFVSPILSVSTLSIGHGFGIIAPGSFPFSAFPAPPNKSSEIAAKISCNLASVHYCMYTTP